MPEGFKRLIAWQKAYALTLETYKITKKYPREEQYSLTVQVRRTAKEVTSMP